MPARRMLLLSAALWLVAAAIDTSGRVWMAAAEPQSVPSAGPRQVVGRSEQGRSVLPMDRVLTPLGTQVELPGMRPQAMSLSPDGRLLAVSGKTQELVIVDPATGRIAQRVKLPVGRLGDSTPVSPQMLEAAAKNQLSYTGLIFAADGRRIYLSNVEGDVKVFQVDGQGKVSGLGSIDLPPAKAPRRAPEIPAGLALSADGRRLYVCGNLSNRLLEIDAESGRVLQSFDVGVAPFDVVLAGSKAIVSNWGGRRPGAGDLTGPAGRGTLVRVDPVRHIASEGSVTIIDLDSGGASREIVTGLGACGLCVSPDKRYVVCANAGSDNLSVIDLASQRIVETIWAKPKPSELLGASPNALAFSADGHTLYVANGAQNAIAVIEFAPAKVASKLLGLFPVGWCPGAVVFDAPRGRLYVANIKGLPPKASIVTEKEIAGRMGYNSLVHHGSLSLVPLPASADLPRLSQAVWDNLRRGQIDESLQPPRPKQPARAVPERIGEPSLIKHVVYVIKENRTFDQVLGDVPQGNGATRLCVFGERITPNQHKLVREFVLLDNTYCAGILSADGHQWSTTAYSTNYLERSFAGFPRSYPDGMGEDEVDAMAYSPSGFIWDRALARGVSLRNYGEFAGPKVRWRDAGRKDQPDFAACYRTWQGKSDEVIFESRAMIPTLAPHTPTHYVGWELAVPDQYRADVILRELKDFEARGEFPALTLICLPNDHTSGTKKWCPTPAAMVADNDLAFGRIVEGLSRSRFWRQMAIFAIEDDPQNGWDHVSGYRTTAYVISPHARRKAVVSEHYSTVSVLRTMEQILGLAPLNQFDAAARPMRDCFTDTPDFAPFAAVAANVPLDQMNPEPQAITHPQLRADALACERMNFDQVDRAPEDALNRVLWRAMRGPDEPYPAWAVSLVDDDDD